MPSLLALLGTCLTMVAASDPADYRSGDRDAAPPWPSAAAEGAPPRGRTSGLALRAKTRDASLPDQRRRPAARVPRRPMAWTNWPPIRDPQAGARPASRCGVRRLPRRSKLVGGPPFRRDGAGRRASKEGSRQGDFFVRPRQRSAAAVDPRPASGCPGFPAGVGRARAPDPLPAHVPVQASASPAATASAADPRPASGCPAVAAPSLSLGGRAERGPLPNASPINAVCTVGGALSIVLGLFMVVAWAMRKAGATRRAGVAQRGVRDPRLRTVRRAAAGATPPLRRQAATGLDHAARCRDAYRSDRPRGSRPHRGYLPAGQSQEFHGRLPAGLPANGHG